MPRCAAGKEKDVMPQFTAKEKAMLRYTTAEEEAMPRHITEEAWPLMRHAAQILAASPEVQTRRRRHCLRRNTNPPTSPTEQNPTSSPSEEGPCKHLCFHPTPTGVGSLKTASKHGKLARPIPRGRETSAQPFAQPNGRRRTRKEHTTPNGKRGRI